MTAMEAAVKKRDEAEKEIAEVMQQSAEAMESAGLIIHESNDPQRVEIINLTRWLGLQDRKPGAKMPNRFEGFTVSELEELQQGLACSINYGTEIDAELSASIKAELDRRDKS